MSNDVNLEQTPDEFAQMATSEDPNGQPKEEEPTGSQPVEGTPKDKPAVEPEKKPDEPEAKKDPNGQPEKTREQLQQDWDNANKKISEMGEAKAKLFKTSLSLVDKNPDLIKDVYNSDPDTAQQIIKEKWGYDSYEELMAHAKIDEMKEFDPDGAKREEELLKVKKDNESILKQLRTGAESSFYTNKGITNNPFDPKYQAIQEALKNISSEVKKDNFAEALEMAHTLAFPARTEDDIKKAQDDILLAKGSSTPESKGGGQKPPTKSNLSLSLIHI